MSSEHRLHPYSILFAFLAQIRVFILPGVFVYFGVGSRDNDWWQPWMMLFVLPTAGVAVLRYATYRYRYEPNELVIRTGLLFRKERHIPYARIQNIDAVQNVLHRLLRVVDIRIETGGGQSAEATMSVLPLAALTEMRQRVFAERAIAARDTAAAVEVDRGDEKPILQLSVRELLLCGFIENRGAVLIAAGFGVVWEIGLFDRLASPLFGQETIGRGVLRDLARGGLQTATALLWSRIGITIAVLIGLLLLIRVFSMGWAIVRLYGFTLTLVDGDARSEFGLLTRVAMTIPLRRIQSLTVREGPLHRLFARAAVKVNTAGGHANDQNQQSEREYLAPILRTFALDDFVRTVIGVSVANTAWQPVHPRAFRREIKGWLVPAFVLCAASVVVLNWFALATVPVALAWAIVGARQTVKHLGWAVTDEAVLFKSGWLWRRVVVVRLAKIQVVAQHESPFDRRTQMARVYVDTAGASLGSAINIPYLPREQAATLYARLTREAATTQFRW
jgi:putative membrane protein